MTTPVLALRDAIRDRLKADPAFKAIAVKRIYDEVPTDLKGVFPPYAYFGPMRRTPYDGGCLTCWTVQARIYVVSTASDRTQGWTLLEAVSDALDGIEREDMALAAPFSLQKSIDVVQAGDVVDPLAAKSVFLDLTTIIARHDPGQED